MSRARRVIVAGVMLSLFMASMEATVVATAMPTIVAQLGGLEIYGWVFSAFMLASTATVPIYGKISDLYGRRTVFAAAMGLFLIGSLLCGRAASMEQLVAFRVLQGLGAGGVLPLAFIIVGVLFTFEQRARIQGLFAGVWGFSSLVGPLLGGFLVDRVSWPWVFYINVPPGVVATALIWLAWRDDARSEPRTAAVDYLGAILLTAAVVTLLAGLFRLHAGGGLPLLALAGIAFAALAWVERRAADPVLPLRLFRDRLFRAASLHGFLSGCALFGSIAFVPLFVQAVLGTSATAAGAAVMPIMLGWVAASMTGSRLLLRIHYRTLALAGMAALVAGTFLMIRIGPQTAQIGLIARLALMGIGMGLSVPTLLIAVQTAVAPALIGTATSTLHFSRSIGGAVGVSLMGLALTLRLDAALRAAGLGAPGVNLNRLLDPIARGAPTAIDAAVRAALGQAIQIVFAIAFAAAALGFAATVSAPRGHIAGLAAARRREPAAAAAARGRSAAP